ncbi:MAG: hypothetical protein NT169_24455 [Chloroflexi bacterium]|nr:hypothetical protein [Chloroflexota bacterium]
MSRSNLLKKLLIKPGQRVLILNAPPDYPEALGPLPEGAIQADGPDGTLDFVHLFVKDSAELARLAPVALAAIKRDGLLWISYPKKSSGVASDLTRDEGWAPIYEAGLRPVTQIAVDEVWSAVRFRPMESVKAKTK